MSAEAQAISSPIVDAASPSKAVEVIKLLLKSVDKLPLESLRIMRSPVAVMTEWLQADESPAGFTVDQDAIMRATGESKAQVAYKRHTLEANDIRRHIAAGKQCTRLAMTWSDKISFVLDESLAIKSVKPLEIIKEIVLAPRTREGGHAACELSRPSAFMRQHQVGTGR